MNAILTVAQQAERFAAAARQLKPEVVRWAFGRWQFNAVFAGGPPTVATFTATPPLVAQGGMAWYIDSISGGISYPVANPEIPVGIEFRIRESSRLFGWSNGDTYFSMADLMGGATQTPNTIKVGSGIGYLVQRLGELTLELRQNTNVLVPAGTYYCWIRLNGTMLPEVE